MVAAVADWAQARDCYTCHQSSTSVLICRELSNFLLVGVGLLVATNLLVKWTDLLIKRACVLFLTLFTRHSPHENISSQQLRLF